MMRTLLALSLAGGILATAAGCHRQTSDPAAADAGAWVGRENITVTTEHALQVGPAISGTLAAERSATMRAEVGGAIVALNVDAGQSVARGAVLARIDDAGLRDAYESAKAAVTTSEMNAQLARKNAERAQALTAAGATAERDLEVAQWTATSAESQLADAKARLSSAEKQLDKTVVRAPFNGVVSERPANLGDVLQSGNPILTVIDPTTLKFDGAIPAEDREGVKVGTPVSFTVSGTSAPITGHVSRMNPALDPATRQVRVTVAVPNEGGRLLAGLFAEGRVATSTRSSVVVPNEAVDRKGIRPFVVRIKDGRVDRVEVELGVIDEAQEQTEVLQGLAAGDTLLLGGARGLPPGTLVRVGSPAELNRDSAGDQVKAN
jgi:membrane fusion protein, multidrug efflux system